MMIVDIIERLQQEDSSKVLPIIFKLLPFQDISLSKGFHHGVVDFDGKVMMKKMMVVLMRFVQSNNSREKIRRRRRKCNFS
jgi:hypothetical protein